MRRRLSLDAAPGLYLVAMCVGDDFETCEPTTGVFPVRMYDGDLRELEPGSTIAGADRINLVLAGSGLGQGSAQLIREILMVDGVPRGVDDEGLLWPIDGTAPATDRISLRHVRHGTVPVEPTSIRSVAVRR